MVPVSNHAKLFGFTKQQTKSVHKHSIYHQQQLFKLKIRKEIWYTFKSNKQTSKQKYKTN